MFNVGDHVITGLTPRVERLGWDGVARASNQWCQLGVVQEVSSRRLVVRELGGQGLVAIYRLQHPDGGEGWYSEHELLPWPSPRPEGLPAGPMLWRLLDQEL